MGATRTEHLAWCRDRALAELDAGSPAGAAASLLASDLGKHPDVSPGYAQAVGQLASIAAMAGADVLRDMLSRVIGPPTVLRPADRPVSRGGPGADAERAAAEEMAAAVDAYLASHRRFSELMAAGDRIAARRETGRGEELRGRMLAAAHAWRLARGGAT